jgi:hypothetical protein
MYPGVSSLVGVSGGAFRLLPCSLIELAKDWPLTHAPTARGETYEKMFISPSILVHGGVGGSGTMESATTPAVSDVHIHFANL